MALICGTSVLGCATLYNIDSELYALDIDGNVFLVQYKGLLASNIVINGVTYPLSAAEPRPSKRDKIDLVITLKGFDAYAQSRWGVDWNMDVEAQDLAVANSICPGAPDNWSRYVPGKYLLYYTVTGTAPVFVPPPPPPPLLPDPQPSEYPTLTPEQFQKVELAYEKTWRYLEQQGKRVLIRTAQDRESFISKYQGSPNTAAVNAAREYKLPVYSVSAASEKNTWPARGNFAYLADRDVVFIADDVKNNDFLKVRIIHDWVSDIFAYDQDLLSWMDGAGRNAEYTLGAIIKRERGVCFEYAILFCFLMNAAGVDTYLICDSSQPGVGHAYNMVVIDGTGYIIDTTWDSGNEYENGRITQFNRMVSKKFFMPDVAGSYTLRGW
jgi:hypothetical protein